MDAELSLIMANVGLARQGSFVLDPFVGTGSFLVTSSHFGAFTMGSDIDGRQIRGKGNNKNIESNAIQYDLTHRILGTVVCDIAHHPWRETEFWDAIICDPPYGVRAGAKKIAVNPKTPPKTSPFNADGSYKLPQTVPYELDDVLTDLIAFAAKHLTPCGRLVYWLPTITESYSAKDVPRHKRLRLVDNCEQDFGKWARRLIVMEKLGAEEPDLDVEAMLVEIEKGIAATKLLDGGAVKVGEDGTVTLIDNPAHRGFRDGYFTSFASTGPSSSD
ncbi:S-adenosyl-L-methionine-dependent methyltransferase [Chytriomyces sp. MP71]|nr:S-adenosyl-L-methionine-dependent methyltransferase [Chytriomyces sp. MP71]